MDPLTAAATMLVNSALQTVGSEAVRPLGEGLGALVRRRLGGDVRMPATQEQGSALVERLVPALREHPSDAAAVELLARLVPDPQAVERRPEPLRPALPTTRHFTDRRPAFRALDRELRRTGPGARAAALWGPPGHGASAVALHWADARRQEFPDGVLHVDLRGEGVSSALTRTQVLYRLLAQLGEKHGDIPATADGRLARYRALLDGQRRLVLLDHAHSAAQVRGLLVDAPGLMTVLVSHHDLALDEAGGIPVGPLGRRDAARLLRRLAGKERLAGSRSAVRRSVRHCSGVPLALTVLARHARRAPRHDWARTAEGLAEGDGAAHEHDPVQAVLALVYRDLPPRAARLYRLLALRGWRDVDARAAARALGDADEEEAAGLLDTLADRLLLERGSEEGRHRFRPAAREHAELAAAEDEGPGGRRDAELRLLEHYGELAARNDYLALPSRWRLFGRYEKHARSHPPHTVTGEQSAAALAELARERENLLTAVAVAEEYGRVEDALELCQSLWPLLLKEGGYGDLLGAMATGARLAAEHRPGTPAEGRMHTQHAYALSFLGRREEAAAAYERAARAEREAGHLRGAATAVEALAVQRLHQWNYPEAERLVNEAWELLDGLAEGDEGFADVPRARAILLYHSGRAHRGLNDREGARARFEEARQRFADLPTQEGFNEAKCLVGLAGTHLDEGEGAAAAARLDEAAAVLEASGGAAEVRREIEKLRDRCPG